MFIVTAGREIKRNITEPMSKKLDDIDVLLFSGIDSVKDCSILAPLDKSDSEEFTTDTDDYDLLQDHFIVPHKITPSDSKKFLSLQLLG